MEKLTTSKPEKEVRATVPIIEILDKSLKNYLEVKSTLHSSNRGLLWAKGLPFYTIISDSQNIHLKEYPDGHKEYVQRYFQKDGTFKDEIIKAKTL